MFSRKNELPLDKMCLVCEVTKKSKEEITQTPREGAYIHGLFMEVYLYICLIFYKKNVILIVDIVIS